jgi:copper chaperone
VHALALFSGKSSFLLNQERCLLDYIKCNVSLKQASGICEKCWGLADKSLFLKRIIEQVIEETCITLSRLNCSGCVRNVTKALLALPSVEVVSTDIPSKTVHLRYEEDQTTLDVIKTALAAAKYPVAEEEAIGS